MFTDNAQSTIDELHNKGKWVSCYISVGTVETWRNDAGAFPSEAVGNSWDDWAGEKFLDVSQQVRTYVGAVCIFHTQNRVVRLLAFPPKGRCELCGVHPPQPGIVFAPLAGKSKNQHNRKRRRRHRRNSRGFLIPLRTRWERTWSTAARFLTPFPCGPRRPRVRALFRSRAFFGQSVRDIMEARIEKAAGMKCDAIEPDNMSVSVKRSRPGGRRVGPAGQAV